MQYLLLNRNRTSESHYTSSFFAALALFSSLCLHFPIVAQQIPEACCHDAIPLDLGAKAEFLGGSIELHYLTLPSAGLLTLDLVRQSPGSSTPDTEFQRVDKVEGSAIIVSQSPTHLILAVEGPEILTLRTYSPTPFRLLTHFEAARVVKEDLFSDLGSTLLVRTRFFNLPTLPLSEPEEVDTDPDKSPSAQGSLLVDLIHLSPQPAATEPAEVDPDPDSPLSTHPVQLLDRLQPVARILRPQVLSLDLSCETARLQTGDDHSDSFTCPTPIPGNLAIAGTLGFSHLGSSSDPDQDMFRINVPKLTTVEVFTTGPTDTFLTLHDSSGKRLAADDDGAIGTNSRIVITLAPGQYVVRVAGAGGAEGPYQLQVAGRQPSL